jgi:hypothetical protein
MRQNIFYFFSFLTASDLNLIIISFFVSDVQVRSYPRRALTEGESHMSLSDLGLTGKQEALFLEKI